VVKKKKIGKFDKNFLASAFLKAIAGINIFYFKILV
jgi:hypothetical protein